MRAPSKNVGRRLDSRFFLLSYAKSTTFDVLRHIRAVTHRATRGARVGRLRVGARFVALLPRAERRAKLRDHVSRSAPEVSARR